MILKTYRNYLKKKIMQKGPSQLSMLKYDRIITTSREQRVPFPLPRSNSPVLSTFGTKIQAYMPMKLLFARCLSIHLCTITKYFLARTLAIYRAIYLQPQHFATYHFKNLSYSPRSLELLSTNTSQYNTVRTYRFNIIFAFNALIASSSIFFFSSTSLRIGTYIERRTSMMATCITRRYILVYQHPSVRFPFSMPQSICIYVQVTYKFPCGLLATTDTIRVVFHFAGTATLQNLSSTRIYTYASFFFIRRR